MSAFLSLDIYLAKKPVQLEDYSDLNDSYKDDDEDEIEQDIVEDRTPMASLTDATAAIEQVKSQYQASRSNGMSINLARFGLTTLQLGLALFSFVIFFSHMDEQIDDPGKSEHTSVEVIVQAIAWTYALILSLVHIIRPMAAFKLWIRPQMDLFYVLEFTVMSLFLYSSELLFSPFSFWPLWLKLDLVAWTDSVLLLLTSLMTRPYQALASMKIKEGEVGRLPSPEFASSLYSQLTFSWVNPLVYLGYRRPLQDTDLADIEQHDYSVVSIRRYNLVNQNALHIGRRIFVHTVSFLNVEIFGKALRRKDMAAPADKSEEDKTGDKKKDGTLNIANLIAVDVKKLDFLSAMSMTSLLASWTQQIKRRISRTPAIVIEEPSAEDEVVQERFQLKNIPIDFPVGKLSVIVGPTGSGKSALLLALLGELERLSGNMYLPRLDYDRANNKGQGSGLAYVAQTAWLQNTTIRNNILFGREIGALVTDFDILEAGDMTGIGELGITLSGGQKQRVALARAVYSDAKVLLLDDCLSAVDTHTGKHLFRALTGPLVEGRTVLMVTHQVQLTMNAASLVVVLNQGEVLGQGPPGEVVHNEWVDHISLVASIDGDSREVSTLHNEEGTDPKPKKDKKDKVGVKLTEDEKKTGGAVAWKVYKTYLNASGGWPFWIGLVILFLTREVVYVAQNAWLAVWVNKMAVTTGSVTIKTFEYLMSVPASQSFYNSFATSGNQSFGAMTMHIFGKGDPETVKVDYYLGIYVLL
ncbi:hypothetical protein BGZ83_009002, partial [Gryganskiella cystojenkinii]